MVRPRGAVGNAAVRHRGDARGVRPMRSVWTPLTLSPRLWLRGDLGTTLDGSDLSSWADQSGNGNTATGTVGRRPALSAAAINGRDAFLWNRGTDDQMTLAGVAVAASMSVIVVCNVTSIDSGYSPLLYAAASAPSVYLHHATPATPALQWSGAARNAGPATIVDSVWRALRFMWSPTTLYYAVNNGADQTAAHSLTASGSFTEIGAVDVTFNFGGSIAELMVVPSVLAAGQITSLNAYLSTRYAIW